MQWNFQPRLNQLAEAARTFPWHDREAYAAFMAQVFYYSRHTTRILAFAGSRFGFEDSAVHERFLRHCAEEMHHERMAEHDVKSLGFKLADFPEFASTTAFYGMHYQTIERNGPWSIFGYIVALEGVMVDVGGLLYDVISKAHGADCTTFVKLHAAEDVEHMEEATRTLAALTPATLQAVREHFETSCYLFERMMEDCAKYASAGLKKTG